MDFNWFDFVVLPVLIMMARVVDVSLDTIRVIMVAKGYRNLAPFVGFFQSLIWLITITRIMANLDNWFTYIGYALGFGLGTYMGMILEGKLALGHELVRVITRKGADDLINGLREKGYPVTTVPGMGREHALVPVTGRSVINSAAFQTILSTSTYTESVFMQKIVINKFLI